MREIIINRIEELINMPRRYETIDHQRRRLNPIKDWLLEETMHLKYVKSKVQTQRRESINLKNLKLMLFTANVSDEKVLELFELAYPQCEGQY